MRRVDAGELSLFLSMGYRCDCEHDSCAERSLENDDEHREACQCPKQTGLVHIAAADPLYADDGYHFTGALYGLIGLGEWSGFLQQLRQAFDDVAAHG